MVSESVKDEFKGAAIGVIVGILFEALDIDKLVDRFTPSLDKQFAGLGDTSAEDQGVESDATVNEDSKKGFTAEDLEQDEP